MKKIMIMLGALALFGATAYAQTQKTNRTKTRSHDRTETIQDTTTQKTQIDKTEHQPDMDRNNPASNTPPPDNKNTDKPK